MPLWHCDTFRRVGGPQYPLPVAQRAPLPKQRQGLGPEEGQFERQGEGAQIPLAEGRAPLVGQGLGSGPGQTEKIPLVETKGSSPVIETGLGTVVVGGEWEGQGGGAGGDGRACAGERVKRGSGGGKLRVRQGWGAVLGWKREGRWRGRGRGKSVGGEGCF